MAGGLCRDSQETWVFGFVLQLGRGCILKEELHAMLTRLKLVREKGYKKVVVEFDSLMTVNKVNQPLQ